MKRWTKAAALALVFLVCLNVPAAASGTVQFYLTGQADSLNQEIKVDLHPGAGQAVQNTLSFSTPVNRMTMGSAAYVVPQQAGTWVTVDYLTDLNGDGAYDLVTDDAGTPSGDSLTGADSLTAWSGTPVVLETGKSLRISAETLLTGGRTYLTRTGTNLEDKDLYAGLLYMVQVWDADGQESDCFYLRLYEGALPDLCAGDLQDIEPGSWYYGAVDYVLSKGLMSGTGDSRFSPEQVLSRAMLAQILYAMNGRPVSGGADFTDVAADRWYAGAVSWAEEQGLMHGVSAGRFAPEAQLTREQLALILYQYMQGGGKPGIALKTYQDSSAVSSWARPAVEWAVANGLISGHGNGRLDPGGAVTRAEFAAVLRSLKQMSA